MKKNLLALTLSILSLFFIIGCSKTNAQESPSVVVENMFKKIDSGNYEDINKPLEEMYTSSNVNKVPNEIYINLYKSIKWGVLEEKIEKNTSTVKVNINSISYNDIFTMAALQVYEDNYDENGSKITTDANNSTDQVINSLIEFSKNAPSSDKTVTIKLQLIDNEWVPTIDKTLWNEILGVSLK